LLKATHTDTFLFRCLLEGNITLKNVWSKIRNKEVESQKQQSPWDIPGFTGGIPCVMFEIF
jgi:hypothetical protein